MPLLWVLTGAKGGDNAQALAAAAASGLPAETKRITFVAGHPQKVTVQASLDGVESALSDPLAAPWPDVVLTIGRQLSCVALWIKQQSGGRTRVALLNAPKGRADDFDLVVLPPWYRNSGRANILAVRMPLIGIGEDRLAEARARFAPLLADMPRPLHVLLVGGDMGLRPLEPEFIADVARRVVQGAGQGSVFAATSRRTPPAVAEALAAALRPGDRLFRWGSPGENPYPGLLAHGDSFTVTADSLSMLIEVARLGKPLVVAEPPPPRGVAAVTGWLDGLLRPRDLGKALSILYGGGWAVPLGRPPRPPRLPLPDDSALVGAGLRRLAGVAG